MTRCTWSPYWDRYTQSVVYVPECCGWLRIDPANPRSEVPEPGEGCPHCAVIADVRPFSDLGDGPVPDNPHHVVEAVGRVFLDYDFY